MHKNVGPLHLKMSYKLSLTKLLLVLLPGVTAAYGSSSNEAADQLLACIQGIYRIPGSTVEVFYLGNECIDAFRYYAHSSFDLGDETKFLARAILNDFENNCKKEVLKQIMKFAESLCGDCLDDDTKKKVAQGIRRLEEIYEVIMDVKVKQEVLQRTLERIALTGLLSSTGTKWALNMGKYSVPVGIFADVAELGLRKFGYEKEGKAVGATGNTVSGAMLGFSVGGPPGAAIGGGLGLLMWWI